MQRMQDAFVPEYSKRIREALQVQFEAAAAAVAAGADPSAAVSANSKQLNQAIASLYRNVMPHFAGKAYNAIQSSTKDFGDKQMSAWITAVENWMMTKGSRKIAKMDAYSKQVIASIIANAWEIDPATGARLGRLSAKETARLIQSKFAEMEKYRAERIARTEITSASNWGHDQGAQSIAADTGLRLQKVWITAIDDVARADHLAAHNQTVAADEDFIVGGVPLAFPGDPNASDAGQIINCRCTHVHEVIE